MEWSWRTVLILIGLLAIAAIMIDGFRRMKRARAEALRLDIQPAWMSWMTKITTLSYRVLFG